MAGLYFLLGVALLFTSASSAPQKKILFPPPLLGLPPYESATPVFVFDGLDYDEMPSKLRDEHDDCYSHYFKCIRNRTLFPPVCIHDDERGRDWKTDWATSICEVDLENCNRRVVRGYGVYGTNMRNDNMFYVGDFGDVDCPPGGR